MDGRVWVDPGRDRGAAPLVELVLDELVDADVADVDVAIAEVVVVVHRGLELRELAVRVRGLEVGVAALARRGRFGEAPHLMPAVSVPWDDGCGF